MSGKSPDYLRVSEDGGFAAWYCESWYYGHHYRLYSFSPWHSCDNGTRYEQEEDARRAVDEYMDGYELSRGFLVQEDSSQGRGR